jgi:hypothetical protein
MARIFILQCKNIIIITSHAEERGISWTYIKRPFSAVLFHDNIRATRTVS